MSSPDINIITTKSKKEIVVFDNLFSRQQIEDYFDFISKSLFSFNGSSNNQNFSIQPHAKPYLQSMYSIADLWNFGLTDSKPFKPVQPYLRALQVQRSYVYVSDHTTVHHFHTDPGRKTLLYYPMLEWKNEYGGETMFSNEQTTEIEYTSLYVPGRVILFDASIPHKMSAPSSSCPFYRFTFVINWETVENK